MPISPLPSDHVLGVQLPSTPDDVALQEESGEQITEPQGTLRDLLFFFPSSIGYRLPSHLAAVRYRSINLKEGKVLCLSLHLLKKADLFEVTAVCFLGF